MNITIFPKKLTGSVIAIPSKSQAHRLLICAAFADAPTTLICPDTNRDIEATVDCLNALGAAIMRVESGYCVIPATKIPETAVLNCCESGSTLRFMLPVAGALGVDTTFLMEGRLPQRPLSPLWEEMERMGCRLSRPSENTVRCEGKLRSGSYAIPGDISSQFITGLLLACPLMDGASTVTVIGDLESKPYVEMTQKAMALFGVTAADFRIAAGTFKSPGTVIVEGDWSNAAFFLGANALGNNVTVDNLNADSAQGDRKCAQLVSDLVNNCTISAADIPDLVPILSVVAAAGKRRGVY